MVVFQDTEFSYIGLIPLSSLASSSVSSDSAFYFQLINRYEIPRSVRPLLCFDFRSYRENTITRFC